MLVFSQTVAVTDPRSTFFISRSYDHVSGLYSFIAFQLQMSLISVKSLQVHLEEKIK